MTLFDYAIRQTEAERARLRNILVGNPQARRRLHEETIRALKLERAR